MHKSVWRVMGILITTPGKVEKILIPRSEVMGLLQHIQDLEEKLKEVETDGTKDGLSITD